MKQWLIFGVIGMAFTMFAVAQTFQEGNATWYETPGNISLQAAHATLPFGTRIRVANLNNGMETIVMISSRIQNDPNRILNISQEAARQLEMGDIGSITPVTIEVLTTGPVIDPPPPIELATAPETPPPPPSYTPAAAVLPRMPDAQSNGIYRVQVGSYRSTLNAQNTFEKLRAAGFSPAYERYEDYYRVVLPGVRAADMQYTAQLLGNIGIREVWIRQEN